MRFRIEKNVVEFHPENPQETADLEVLWRKLVDCVRDTGKLVPIGEFVPEKKNSAMFHIEGGAAAAADVVECRAAADGTYVCTVCNRYEQVKAGEGVPECCGRPMESAD